MSKAHTANVNFYIFGNLQNTPNHHRIHNDFQETFSIPTAFNDLHSECVRHRAHMVSTSIQHCFGINDCVEILVECIQLNEFGLEIETCSCFHVEEK